MKIKHFSIVLACILALSLLVVSCGGKSNAKDLAKQAYDLTQKTMQAADDLDFEKIEALTAESTKLQQEVSNLSVKEAAVYLKEFARLSQ